VRGFDYLCGDGDLNRDEAAQLAREREKEAGLAARCMDSGRIDVERVRKA
jgi:hypothetical protein